MTHFCGAFYDNTAILTKRIDPLSQQTYYHCKPGAYIALQFWIQFN